MQQLLIGAMSAMAYAAEQAIQNNCDKALITILTDGLAIGSQCQHDFNPYTQAVMKKELSHDLAALCNSAIESGEFLFGDLSKLTKDIRETSKLTRKVRPSQSSTNGRSKTAYRPSYNNNETRRFQPYGQRPRRGHFLDRGRGYGPKREKEGTIHK